MRQTDPQLALALFLVVSLVGTIGFAASVFESYAVISSALADASTVAYPDKLPLVTSTILLPIMAGGLTWSLARPGRSRQIRTASFWIGLCAATAMPLATWALLTWALARGGYVPCADPKRMTFSTVTTYAAPGSACR